MSSLFLHLILSSSSIFCFSFLFYSLVCSVLVFLLCFLLFICVLFLHLFSFVLDVLDVQLHSIFQFCSASIKLDDLIIFSFAFSLNFFVLFFVIFRFCSWCSVSLDSSILFRFSLNSAWCSYFYSHLHLRLISFPRF